MKRLLTPVLLLSALCFAPLSHAACEKEVKTACDLANKYGGKADSCLFDDPAFEINGANGNKSELNRLAEMYQQQYDADAAIASGDMMMAMQDYKLCVIKALKSERDKH
jgi:hypothetical protein